MDLASLVCNNNFSWKNLPIPYLKGLICSYGVLASYTKEELLKLYTSHFNSQDFEQFGEVDLKIVDYKLQDVVYLIRWRRQEDGQYILILGSEL